MSYHAFAEGIFPGLATVLAVMVLAATNAFCFVFTLAYRPVSESTIKARITVLLQLIGIPASVVWYLTLQANVMNVKPGNPFVDWKKDDDFGFGSHHMR